MNKLIEIQSVTASYDAKTVLQDVSLTLRENDFLGIIGPNGGGKTTLLKVILGLLKPSRGQVVFYEEGRPVPSLRMGYLPQINRIDRRFPVSVSEVVASGLMVEKKRLRNFSPGQRQRIADTIDWIGLGGLSKRPIGELSGGELQRVLLGRAIVSHPKVLILDEPNTYVDKLFESRLYGLLAEINRDTAVILVSHDVGTILPLVKNVACVNETLHYHEGNRLTEAWLDEAYHCPVAPVGHGELPYGILRKQHIASE
ncbi:MAG: metal ABC transporter ATP-binding protein [Tannerella sp.]|jgi:zinc transport system ATP-binding protein|nr:metal ABC transporter ATP-binding protein [Tannerella sp.]